MKKTFIYLFSISVALVLGMYIGHYLLQSPKGELKLSHEVITSNTSQDNKYVAKVLFESVTKTYNISVTTKNNTELMLMNKIIPKGYHDPVINLLWSSPDVLSIEVNHDFGDNNLLYELNMKDLSINEKL